MSKSGARVPAGLIALLGLLLLSCNQPPGVPERPRGPGRIVKGAMARCTTETSGRGEEVRYQFDWGDGTMSAWSEWCPTDTSVNDTHVFLRTGPLSIRARAQNTRGQTSGWSDALSLTAVSGDTVVKWTYGYIGAESGDSVGFNGSVAASPDGKLLYAIDEAGPSLHILNREGVMTGLWDNMDGGVFYVSPTIGPTSECFLSPGPEEASLCAVLPSGVLTWQWGIDDFTSAPAISPSGVVYVVTERDSLYALDRDIAIWGQPTCADSADGEMLPPAISNDGSLVIATDGLRLLAFRSADGSLAWSSRVSEGVWCSPVIGPDGSIFVVDGDGRLTAFSPTDGSELWHHDLGDVAYSSPIVGPDGVVYASTDNGSLHAVDPLTHSSKWVLPLGGSDLSSPALTETGVLYVRHQLAESDWLVAIDSRDGTVRGEIEVPEGQAATLAENDAAPMIGPDGTVYVCGYYAVVAIWGDGPPPKTGWPQYRHDWCRSGNASWQPGAK